MNKFITVLTMLAVFQVSCELRKIRSELREKMAWNIDAARGAYLSDTEYLYKNGCTTGVTYPEEYKQPSTSFNEHSPTIWCNEKFKEDHQDYLDKQVTKLGRPDLE